MNKLQKIALATTAMALTAESSFAAINAGGEKVGSGLRGNEQSLDQAIM
jgi:hypothetical protein